MKARWVLLAAFLPLLATSACRQRSGPSPQAKAATEALARVRARYADADVERFRGYRLIGVQLFSVAPRRVAPRCAPRWIVGVDDKGRVLAKKELLREATKGLTSPPKTRARLCQDMLLNQLGVGILFPDKLATRCQAEKAAPSYCQDEVRALVSAPSTDKGRLLYWRHSCADGRVERVELDMASLTPTIRSSAALLDAQAFARSPADWARKRLPTLSRAARRDLLKRMSCKEPKQRRLLLEHAEKDKAPEVRSRALERLVTCSGKELDALLTKMARRDPAPTVRQRAIELLAGRPLSRRARSLLQRIQRDRKRSTGERYAALRALKKRNAKLSK